TRHWRFWCACSSSSTARLLRGTATTVSRTSTRRFGHVACPRQRIWCGARRDSAPTEAFAADFRCVSTVAFGPGITPRTRLSSRVLLLARRFPSWSTPAIRASSTPAVTSNTGQTPEPLSFSGTGSAWSSSGWRGSPGSSGCGDRQCPDLDGPTAGPASPASTECSRPSRDGVMAVMADFTLGAEEELLADAIVGMPLCDQCEDFAFARGQLVERTRLARSTDEPGDDGRIEHAFVFVDPLERVDEEGDVFDAVLEQVARPLRVVLEQPHCVMGVEVVGEHEHADGRL